MNLLDALHVSIASLHGVAYADMIARKPSGPDKVLIEDRDYAAMAEDKERY